MEILVRFNHDGQKDSQRWRLVWDGKEFICNSVRFECATTTTQKPVIVNNEPVTKWHIQAINPTKIIFDSTQNQLDAIVL
jgi:hypothetical protein